MLRFCDAARLACSVLWLPVCFPTGGNPRLWSGSNWVVYVSYAMTLKLWRTHMHNTTPRHSVAGRRADLISDMLCGSQSLTWHAPMDRGAFMFCMPWNLRQCTEQEVGARVYISTGKLSSLINDVWRILAEVVLRLLCLESNMFQRCRVGQIPPWMITMTCITLCHNIRNGYFTRGYIPCCNTSVCRIWACHAQSWNSIFITLT